MFIYTHKDRVARTPLHWDRTKAKKQNKQTKKKPTTLKTNMLYNMVDNNKQEMNHAVPEECLVHDSYKTSAEQD
jgi:hypothetical protein